MSISSKYFLGSAEQLFNATKADDYVGLHDSRITTNNQWDIAKKYGADDVGLSIRYPAPQSGKTWESMVEEQVYFLLLVAAAEGEL